MIASKRFWSGFVVGLAMGGLEDLYKRLTVPHPFLASLGTFAAAYGLLWGAAAVAEWRKRRREWRDDERVEEWVVHDLLGGRVTNPAVAARHAGHRGGTKIIGGRIGGSPSDHGPSTRESPRLCDSRGSRE